MVSKVIPEQSKKVKKSGKVLIHRPSFKRNVTNNNKTSSLQNHIGNSKSQMHSDVQTEAAKNVLALFQKPTSWKALKEQINLANVMTNYNSTKLENVDVWRHIPEIYRPSPKKE